MILLAQLVDSAHVLQSIDMVTSQVLKDNVSCKLQPGGLSYLLQLCPLRGDLEFEVFVIHSLRGASGRPHLSRHSIPPEPPWLSTLGIPLPVPQLG